MLRRLGWGRFGAQPFRPLRLATIAVVTYSVILPVTRVYDITTSSSTALRTITVLAALACFLPIQVWLVTSVALGKWGRPQIWALPLMIAFQASLLPVAGVGWVGIIDVAAGLTLVTARFPWSLLLFALLTAAAPLLAIALGHAELAMYFALGVPYTALPLASGLWLIRVARQLQMARVELADQAVVGERLRVDAELRSSVGAALLEIGHVAESARARLGSDPRTAMQELGELADAARRTLVDARHVVGHYRESSLRTELEGATTLLAAMGIEARLDLPGGDLSGALDERARRSLHRAIGDVLRWSPGVVTISVTEAGGGVRIALRSDTDKRTAEVAVT